jgi:methyl-accepting chemotaxis protein
LPQTVEESRQWDEFMRIIPQWVEVNDEIFKMHQDLDEIDILNPDALLSDLQRFRGDHYALEVRVANMILTGESFQGGDDAQACAFGSWMADYQSKNQEINNLLNSVRRPHDLFHQSVGQIRTALQNNNEQEAVRLFTEQMQPASHEVFEHFDSLIEIAGRANELYAQIEEKTMNQATGFMEQAFGSLDKVIEINTQIAENEVASAVSQSATLKMLSLVSMIIGVILAMLLGFFITRSIANPIRRIVDGMSSGAEQVSSASSQVASSSQSQAEGASEQASSLEQTSSSLEEMASQTRQNAQNAQQADEAMNEAAKIVENGVASMRRMSDAINEIKASSSETSKIIKTIDDIAFQTNLLALNAAVEAARAGEAGKGFAVVAEEVRNLAQRSAEAAQNTSQLIEKSQENANNGVTVTEEVSNQLLRIQESASKVNTLISEITAASKEQAQGIEQVNTGVAEMDKVVQQNAADAEESASAAEELSSQASEMERMVAELEAMVGSSGRKGTSAARPATASRGSNGGQSHDRYMQQSSGQRKKLTTKARKQSYDQVIPLDEDEFKDF